MQEVQRVGWFLDAALLAQGLPQVTLDWLRQRWARVQSPAALLAPAVPPRRIKARGAEILPPVPSQAQKQLLRLGTGGAALEVWVCGSQIWLGGGLWAAGSTPNASMWRCFLRPTCREI